MANLLGGIRTIGIGEKLITYVGEQMYVYGDLEDGSALGPPDNCKIPIHPQEIPFLPHIELWRNYCSGARRRMSNCVRIVLVCRVFAGILRGVLMTQ